MKVFSLNSSGFVSVAIARQLGLPDRRTQANVLVSASSKAEAFRLLAARQMDPGSINEREFRVIREPEGHGGDSGAARSLVVAAVLAGVGLFAAPAVIVTEFDFSINSLVIRVEADGVGTVLGRIEYQDSDRELPQFIPTPAGVAGAVWTQPLTPTELVDVVAEVYRIDQQLAYEVVGDAVSAIVDDPEFWQPDRGGVQPAAIAPLIEGIGAALEQHELQAEDLLAACSANVDLVKDLNRKLTEARLQRGRLADRAVKIGQILAVAEIFGVSPARLYQLRDAARVEEARRIRTRRAPAV